MTKISKELLLKLSDFVAMHMGLYFPEEKLHDLEIGLVAAKKELNFEDTQDCIDWLISSSLTREQIEILASYLTIGETYFFRDTKYFEVLEKNILPQIIESNKNKGKRIRIWSAGCCTGEEPYSIAILLHKILSDIHDWNIKILATDINPVFLKKASSGIYSNWSFRKTPSIFKDKYFIKHDGLHFRILPSIKKLISFSYLNLVEEGYPSLNNDMNAMDLILCRNVLMYFIPELARKVALNLQKSLIKGGWIIVNPVEFNFLDQTGLIPVNLNGVILYMKDCNNPILNNEIFNHVIEAKPKKEIEFSLQLPFEFEFNKINNIPEINELKENSYIIIETENPINRDSDWLVDAIDLFKAGLYDEAETRLLKKFSTDNLNADGAILLARINANQGKLFEAFNWCQKAIQLDKTNPSYYYLQAIILQELGNIGEAIIYLEKTLFLDQNYVMAHWTLSKILIQEGKLKESKRHKLNAVNILKKYNNDAILPDCEGITIARLLLIINQSNNGKIL
ncbi:MAG: chemotaxis protein CheR [Bacteroidetes bacterium]|nr:chemotaxis protein CheR [Bacteroidota bacterium]